ncbi:hypothetical protein B4098_1399 [Heyndrickxia coagulans]|uniref:Uncharacterized protein n=1 Tax=Heyndrickxia coagulans TaxID=1398 RepID=A0A150JYP8_HEYCO|nr:hypothetical protein B4098_1399 [Heyndrickxia coagulans]
MQSQSWCEPLFYAYRARPVLKKCSVTSWFPYRNGKIKHFRKRRSSIGGYSFAPRISKSCPSAYYKLFFSGLSRYNRITTSGRG